VYPDLALEQAPPVSVPMRFFITAPLFGFAAALLMLYEGPAIALSRWSPATLAFTHLLTLGFMGLAMCGAIVQLVPVLSGAGVPKVRGVSRLVYLLLVAGIVAFIGGLLLPSAPFIQAARLSLGAGFSLFAGAVLLALFRSWTVNATIGAMRLAVISLLITVLLGEVLASAHAGAGVAGPGQSLLTDSHLAWGVLGWTGLLVMGVAFQVVPMFQVTPAYPQWMTRFLAGLLFAGLLLWTGMQHAGRPAVAELADGWMFVCTAGFAIFAGTTLRLQFKRRRRLEDNTLRFWQLGMLFALAAFSLWPAGRIWPEFAAMPQYPLLIGACLLPGFAVSVINGMLYKIVPFLTWFHLQHHKLAIDPHMPLDIPNMKQVIPARLQRAQLWLHAGTLAALLPAIWRPGWFIYPAGLLMAASSALLFYNMSRAIFLYRRVDRLLRTYPGPLPAHADSE